FLLLVFLPDVAAILPRDVSRVLIPKDGRLYCSAPARDGGGLDHSSPGGRPDHPAHVASAHGPSRVRHHGLPVERFDCDAAAVGPFVSGSPGSPRLFAAWTGAFRRQLLDAHAGDLAGEAHWPGHRLPEHSREPGGSLRADLNRRASRGD